MSADEAGLFGSPVLDGIALVGGSVAGADIDRNEMKSLVPLALGDVRQGLAFVGASFPLVKDLYEIVLRYSHLSSVYSIIEDLMAGPGPHSLEVWKQVAYQYAGNGERVEFDLPRYTAIDFYGAPPPAVRPAVAYETRIRIGVTGTPMTVLSKGSGDYTGGDPGTGEAWMLNGGLRFKLGDVTASGSRIFVSHCPLFSMWSDPKSSRKYASSAPLLEPRDIKMTEAPWSSPPVSLAE